MNSIDKTFFIAGSISGFISVALGAFAAHILKDKLEPDLFNIFEVAVRYEMYHALALIAVAFAAQWIGGYATTAGWLFIAGTVIFSGSLYALSLSGMRWFGAITPIGGVLFLAGWAYLVIGAVKK